MKYYQFALATLIILATPICQAAEYSKTNVNNEIHAATIHTSYPKISANLWTSVGTLQGGKCNYQKDTPKNPYELEDGAGVFLNGTRLKELIGTNYDCAATNYEYDSKLVRDEFKLVKQIIEGEEEYVTTVPPTSQVNLN